MSNDLRMKFELYNKIKAALTYPIIIFSFLTTAILVVLVYVIPSITAVFDTS
jgi:type II secretory pathway component PulF